MSSSKPPQRSFNRSILCGSLKSSWMFCAAPTCTSPHLSLCVFLPAVLKKTKKNSCSLRSINSVCKHFSVFYFAPAWSTWSGIHKLQSCLENQLKTIRGKTSSIPAVFPRSHWLCLITWLQHLKCSLSPRALPRSAISDSFLLPVRENAREVQRAPCPAPSAGNLTASREGAE